MKIVQLTDLHIGLEGEDTNGVDVRGNFLNVLRHLRANPPDHLVLSGDLCFRVGTPEVYAWIREQLADLPVPIWYMSGNHDDPEMLARAFELDGGFMQDGELYYHAILGGREFIFLDTTRYEMSETQFQWLRDQMEGRSDTLLVFMHHPPGLIGVPFMDNKYPLRNWAEVQALFLDYPGEVYVFSGHYHVDKSVHLKNLHIFVTPSTFFQIGQQAAEFRVDHYRVGWRELVWSGDAFQTTVRYLEP
ncbi:MAG: metallophosphoesterase [Lewinellaceae bacterium]|nr:metallophosphoesterase [Lewinellaceae bacterium]